MTGQYKSPGSVTFDRSNQNRGFTLLSFRMANLAKNNYECNIWLPRTRDSRVSAASRPASTGSILVFRVMGYLLRLTPVRSGVAEWWTAD